MYGIKHGDLRRLTRLGMRLGTLNTWPHPWGAFIQCLHLKPS